MNASVVQIRLSFAVIRIRHFFSHGWLGTIILVQTEAFKL
jgi:hypothetical protein